ncbi:NAD-P-binding protein [Vararia minispora EC-137]|uniref:NAD-P-binding protein n=1 Tax=Vararia minispora EC-137 TaxID=1314806 RepID=A0ACB8QUM2_9AGAM|nr:NAD-P-binding protein [Vararia minispora EC-137]
MPGTEQKVWLVTGASSGLGLALIKRVLARGDLAIATARDPSRFTQLFPSPDDRLHVLRLDLLWSFVELQKVMETAVARWGRIDCLVNNAGLLATSGPSEEIGAEHFMECMATNVAGTINVTNAVLPYMRARRQGTVVIIGSRSAYRNEFVVPAYAASKAAIHSYGETLAAELKQFGIRVLVVAPGTFQTAFSSPPIAPNTITDYAKSYEDLRLNIQALEANKGGDPEKAMDVLIDVVRGEGRAREKDGFPLWLVLGEEAVENVRARANKMLDTMDMWGDVGFGLARGGGKE